jgi:hypothetical protein
LFITELCEDIGCMFRSFFSKFQWYRRMCGGRWEEWFIDVPFGTPMWLHEDHRDGTTPPLAVRLCRVENYTRAV